MKLLFYRGRLPDDRPIQEVTYSGLENNDDLWENLAAALGDERCDIVYTGGKREVQYSHSCRVVWVKDVSHYKSTSNPDVVFCRGGFPEGDEMASRFPGAVRIFYGAGSRFYPKGKIKYDIVLVDSQRQFDKVKLKGMNPVMWVKPCAPCFRPMDVKKEYDVCFVADGRFPFRAKIKRLEWTYKTIPLNIKMLHLGWNGKHRPPCNVDVKRVLRLQMPQEYNKCRVGICPYKDYDSAPRVIPEMLACGLPVIALNTVHTNNEVIWADKNNLWEKVKACLNSDYRLPEVTFENTVKFLREKILSEINNKKN